MIGTASFYKNIFEDDDAVVALLTAAEATNMAKVPMHEHGMHYTVVL